MNSLLPVYMYGPLLFHQFRRCPIGLEEFFVIVHAGVVEAALDDLFADRIEFGVEVFAQGLFEHGAADAQNRFGGKV